MLCRRFSNRFDAMRLGIGCVVALNLAAAGYVRAQLSGDWYDTKADAWFASADATRRLNNILSHQSSHGDWPKAINTDRRQSRVAPEDIAGTWDNRATFGEMRVLARAFIIVGRSDFRDAFLRALDHILASQYPTGGWPQYDPPPADGYPRHVTFNDDVMLNILLMLRDVAHSPGFDFVDDERKRRAQAAFARGIDCIVRCQVVVDGKSTVWCAQHDEKSLEPRPGRRFEPASLSAGESAGLVRLLMSLSEPSPAIRRAIESACEWFRQAALHGVRIETIKGDRTLVSDPAAPPIWARFYEIGTMRPLFAGRDGMIRYALAEIPFERRNFYAWYGYWGDDLADEYVRWKMSHGEPR